MAEKNKAYAYHLEATGEEGITESWAACQKKVQGVKARYKGFATKGAAEAWLKTGARYTVKERPTLEKGIYFDAGTGRGIGVEVRVTNEKGENLLPVVLSKKEINEHGNVWLVNGATNNYGELLGCKLALMIAKKKKIQRIFGDSGLVIKYWSKGFIKKNTVVPKTVSLAEEVSHLRKEFEKSGGSIKHVSGDVNPADLGFHR